MPRTNPLTPPTGGLVPAAQDLIGRLLERKPTKRLGMLQGRAKDIKRHRWAGRACVRAPVSFACGLMCVAAVRQAHGGWLQAHSCLHCCSMMFGTEAHGVCTPVSGYLRVHYCI